MSRPLSGVRVLDFGLLTAGASDAPIADEAAHGGRREIVLTDVDAVGTGDPGDVRAIVHDDDRAGVMRALDDG